ncbi:TlpA disulfide reductase family protein [Kurthia sibirica]|uniref:TlpA disulfide reductase family protein n=1 Tax=Kurthia sibirica TaxID=202750 RepID=UPI00116F9EB9|nr:TlpA disulfide reductase family protein [Kurthia sibirica]GEK33644.1 thiol:disulfide interchange protein tlpA [Kurthia sibirica]
MKIKTLVGTLLVAGLIIFAVMSMLDKKEDKQALLATGDTKEFPVSGIEIDEKAPDFTLQTLDGEDKSLSDYKGKKVMINFWATWCPPCRVETPHMVKYYDAAAKKDNFEILSVNLLSNESSSKNVEKFIKEYKMNYPVVLDVRGEIQKQYGFVNIPTSFFVDTKGYIREKVNIIDEKQMKDIIKSLD